MAGDSLVKRLSDEARAAAALDHENLARVFDFGEEHWGILRLHGVC